MLAQAREWAVAGLRWLMWRPRRLAVALVLVLASLLAVNVIGGAIMRSSAAASASASPTADGLPSGWKSWPQVTASTVAPAPAVPKPDQPLETDAPEVTVPPDTTDAETARALRDAATAFMSAYARPAAGTATAQWWARVAPLLTPATAKDADGTQPDNVPWAAVNGDAMLVPPIADAESGLIRDVDVPTDAGTWRVSVTVVDRKVQSWRKL